MKIYPDRLESNLKEEIKPIYIVSGDEPLLKQEACDSIRLALRQRGYTERELFHVDGSFDWQQILYSASSMSLFAEKKLIEVRMPTPKPGDKGAAVFKSYVDNIPEQTVMLIITGRLERATQQTKWFKALDSVAGSVQVWPIEVNQLPGWLNNRIAKKGMSADREAILALVEKVEGNLLAALQEIERIRLISGPGKIGISQVLDEVSDSSRFTVFALIDAALSGDAARTCKVIQGLRSEGTEILQIVGLLGRELRSLSKMSAELSKGQSANSAMQRYKVWSNRKGLVGKALQRHRLAGFDGLILDLAKLDKMAKGLGSGDPWEELTDILLRLAGTRLTSTGLAQKVR
jgi:DNA polymerase-3 subunit delta